MPHSVVDSAPSLLRDHGSEPGSRLYYHFLYRTQTHMRLLQPVAWSKGVFLSPQHLQAQDRFAEDSLRFLAEANSFRCWGFLALAIDIAALSEGRFALSAATGLFPDSLAFDLPDADAAPPSRLLEECFSPSMASQVLYLAVPETRRGGINIAQKRSGQNTRFFSELQLLRDENSTGIEKPVAVARKNLQILAEGESLEGMLTLPLARVVRSEAGQFHLNDDFVPPMINVQGSARLTGILRGIVEVLGSRSSQLSGGRRQRNQSLAEFSASDIANFWLLYTANTHLPALIQMLHTPQLHPEALFLQLLALAGALTTFSRDVSPQDLPRYDHEHLGTCCLALEAVILRLLDTVIPSRFIALPLTLLRDSIYTTELSFEDDVIEGSRFYLDIAAELPTADLIKRSSVLVKACSATHVDGLVRQALPGLPMTHMPSPPHEIPVKLHYQYFSLDHAGVAWESIRRTRNFAVYVPAEIRNPRLELVLLRPSEQSR